MSAAFEVTDDIEYDAIRDLFRPAEQGSYQDSMERVRARREGFKSEFDRLREQVQELETANRSLKEQRDRAQTGVETRDRRIEAIKQLQARKLHELTIAAHNEAQVRDYCFDFDRFMMKQGMEPRHYTREIQVKKVTTTTEYGTLNVEFRAGEDNNWGDTCEDALRLREDDIEWDTSMDETEVDDIEITDHHYGSAEFQELPEFDA